MSEAIKQTVRKERLTKSVSTTNTQSKRIDIPNNIREIIQTINPKIDVEIEVKKDIKLRIENNEMNDNIGKKKGKGNFKSRRYPSDLALIRGTKFYLKPEYNRFELQRLKELKNIPGKQLLMSEIYSQLEENFEAEYENADQNQDSHKVQDFSNISVIKGKQNQSMLPSISQSTTMIDFIPHKDTKIEKEIEELDHWYKQVKQLKKQQKIVDEENLKQAERNLIEQSKGKQSKFFPRQKQRTKTKNLDQPNSEDEEQNDQLSPKRLNERMKHFSQKNKESVLLIAKKQFAELQNSKEFSSVPSTPESKNTPRSNGISQSKVYLVGLLKNNPNSDEDSRRNSVDSRKRSDSIRDSFSRIVKEINQQTRQDDVPSSIRELKKTVLKYVNDVPNLHAKEDNSFKKEDLTPEGIKRILQTFYTMDPDSDNQTNIVEKAKNFEKISNLVEQKLQDNIRDTEALITNKSNTVRILRLENHTITKKMRQIKELSQKLQADMKEIILPNQKEEKELLEPHTLKAPDLKKINTHIEPLNLQMSVSKKAISMVNSITSTSHRSALIESVMVHTSRIHEIERENSILKESYQKFQMKSHYNSDIISSIEIQINQKRKDHKQLSKAKKVFLYEILKLGKDCRQQIIQQKLIINTKTIFQIKDEGLSWIIRSIQNLGEKVFDSHLPDFLDMKAKDFLLQKAQKIQEIQEITTLQNVSLDIYKTNMSLNEHMKNNDAPDYIGDISMIGHSHNVSMISGLNKSIHDNLTLPSIKNNDNSKVNQSFSQVNVDRIKFEETQGLKRKIMKSLHHMFEGLSQQELISMENTIDQLHTTKLTTNDIIYNETKKKIKLMLNTSMQDVTKKKDTLPSTTINHQQSNNITSILESLDHDQTKLNHKIVLYENSTVLNKYDNREQFIQEYEILSKKLIEREKQLKQMEDKELIRVIKEYDYKNYEKRFGVKCGVVLSTLLGAIRADREIIKNGMNKR